MADRNELIQRLQKIQAEAAAIEAELAKPEEPETLTRWKPKHGDVFWFITALHNVQSCIWANTRGDEKLWDDGNCYASEPLAQQDIARRRASKRTYLPKKGEVYWTFNTSGHLRALTWSGDAFDWSRFYIGAVKRTNEEMEAWIKGDGKFWITAPQESEK